MVSKKRLLAFLSIFGPGLLVMLADTDAGSLIISAQSGAVWGYKLLIQQALLMPVLFIVQELAVRLAIVTGRGQGELIKQHFGLMWGWVAVITLVICCIGALITEFTGLAAVGELFGIPVWETMLLIVSFLIGVAWTGSYVSVERVALFLGVFELLFIYIAWQTQPTLQDLASGFKDIPWSDPTYIYLFAGNIGAVIMPWMIFFHQAAIVDKKLNVNNLPAARWDTIIGAVLTQLIMSAMLIITAATVGKMKPNTPLNTVAEISYALVPILGNVTGRILFALGMAGAALVATIVVSLTAAWSVGEVLGFHHSLDHKPQEAPWFYAFYTVILILSALLVTSNFVNLVSLSVAVEVMNTLLLPIVLTFLFLLARRALPDEYRLKGWYSLIVSIVLIITVVFGVATSVMGIVMLH